MKSSAAFLLAALMTLSMKTPADDGAALWPIEECRRVSGTFAEFRADHFHSGLDISTHGQTGLPVRCIKDGRITRVKVSQSGFGRALYVTHADGGTAVYAHLLAFHPGLEDEVFARQKEKGGFELDFAPEPAPAVRRGEVIALSGNSGTTAPHLHIELRDPAQRPRDPGAELGADYETWPTVRRLVFYPLSATSRVNGSPRPVALAPKARGVNFALKDKVVFSGYLGIGIDTVQMNWGNRLGVKEVALHCDDTPVWSHVFDSFSYADYRNTGPFYDRAQLLENGAHVLKLFCPEGAADFFMRDAAGGRGLFCSTGEKDYIRLSPGRHKLRITVTAFDGKQSETEFRLEPAPLACGREEVETGLIHGSVEIKSPEDAAMLKTGPLTRLAIPAENLSLSISRGLDLRAPGLELAGSIWRFGPASAQSRESLLVLPIPEKFLARADRLGIYEQGKDGRWSFVGGAADEKAGTISAKVNFFASFSLAVDNSAPVVRFLNFPAFATGGHIEFSAADTGSGIDVASAVLTIDSHRCFPYFNRKTGTFIWPLREKLERARHEAAVSIRDRAGNETRLKAGFETF